MVQLRFAFTLCAVAAQFRLLFPSPIYAFKLPGFFTDDWLVDFKISREESPDIEFVHDGAAMTYTHTSRWKWPFKPKVDAQADPYASASVLDDAMFPMSKSMPKEAELIFFLLAFVFLFLAGWALFGYKYNYLKAKRIMELFMPTLNTYFAKVDPIKVNLKTYAWHKFEAFATGRTSCRYVLISFDFKRRQCPWHWIILSQLVQNEDYITFDIAFFSLDCFVFALCNKLYNRSFIQDHLELTRTSVTAESADISQNLRLYLNSNDKDAVKFVTYFLNNARGLLGYLENFYISDVGGNEEITKPQMTLKFRVPKTDDELLWMIHFVLELVDYAKNFQMDPISRERICKNRDEIEFRIAQQEALSAKRSVSPKKLEKLMAKREKRSKTPRVKIMR